MRRIEINAPFTLIKVVLSSLQACFSVYLKYNNYNGHMFTSGCKGDWEIEYFAKGNKIAIIDLYQYGLFSGQFAPHPIPS